MPAGRRRVGSVRAVGFSAALSLFVSALALCANRGHNGDVYLQLGAGRFLSTHGLVWRDPFPTVAAGRPWHNQQWLSELAFYRVAHGAGMTGLTIAYALLLGAPLFWLLWWCRHKPWPILVTATALYFPALLWIIHPRAAAFTLLAFSAVVILASTHRSRWTLWAIPAVFALWANLHGGFVAGFLLLALVTAGAALDRHRRVPGSLGWRRIVLVGLSLLAAVGASLATPLGTGVWSYMLSFHNPAISLFSTEWEPVFRSASATAYLAVAVAFAAAVWWRAPRPRPLTPALVFAGFTVAAALSMRNLILLAPAAFLMIARCVPDGTGVRLTLRPIALAAAGTAAAGLVWGLVLTPAREAPYLRSKLVEYALRHPPPSGRIASLAGVSSYILWRSPRTPVVIDGWLEHFSPGQLRGAYAVINGRPEAVRYLDRWNIRGVITRRFRTAHFLEAHGFVLRLRTHEGVYLVR